MKIDAVQNVSASEISRPPAAAAEQTIQQRARRSSAPEKNSPVRNFSEAAQTQQSDRNSLGIEVGKDNGRIVYRVIDEKTGEVIRQIPPEEVLLVARNIEEFLQVEQRQNASKGASTVDVDF